jgi:hypothetical protein
MTTPMTVAEFIEWLKTQDQGAIVQTIRHKEGTGWDDQGGSVEVVDFNPETTSDYTDYCDNGYIRVDAPYYNKRFLLIGEE